MQNVGINALDCHVPYKLLPMLTASRITTVDELIAQLEQLTLLPDIGPKRARAIIDGLIEWYVQEARKQYPGALLVMEAINLKWRWKAELHKYGIITMDQARFVSESQHINIKDTLYPAKQAATAAVRYASFSHIKALAS